MDRPFLDANVLFSAAYYPNAGLLQLWNMKEVVLCSSRYAVEEANRNLADATQRTRLRRLAEKVELFEGFHRHLTASISLPEKDWPVLLAAIEADATHLLTGDIRHFGPYFGKKVDGITILLPGEYLRMSHRTQ